MGTDAGRTAGGCHGYGVGRLRNRKWDACRLPGRREPHGAPHAHLRRRLRAHPGTAREWSVERLPRTAGLVGRRTRSGGWRCRSTERMPMRSPRRGFRRTAGRPRAPQYLQRDPGTGPGHSVVVPRPRPLPVTDFVIERSPDGSTWTVVNDGVSTAQSYTVTGLTNNVTYFFRVAAVGANGRGDYSYTVSGPRWRSRRAPRAVTATAGPAEHRREVPGAAQVDRSTTTGSSTRPTAPRGTTGTPTHRCSRCASPVSPRACGTTSGSSPTTVLVPARRRRQSAQFRPWRAGRSPRHVSACSARRPTGMPSCTSIRTTTAGGRSSRRRSDAPARTVGRRGPERPPACTRATSSSPA